MTKIVLVTLLVCELLCFLFLKKKTNTVLCFSLTLFLDRKNNVTRKQNLEKLYMNFSISEVTIRRAYADFKCCCRDTYDVRNLTNNFKNLPKLQKKFNFFGLSYLFFLVFKIIKVNTF